MVVGSPEYEASVEFLWWYLCSIPSDLRGNQDISPWKIDNFHHSKIAHLNSVFVMTMPVTIQFEGEQRPVGNHGICLTYNAH